jgi:hypothetical protein
MRLKKGLFVRPFLVSGYNLRAVAQKRRQQDRGPVPARTGSACSLSSHQLGLTFSGLSTPRLKNDK